MQIGFDFLENTAPAFAELAYGAWNAPERTNAQWSEILAASRVAVERVTGIARPVFAGGIEQLAKELKTEFDRFHHQWPDRAFSLCAKTVEASEEVAEAFVQHCKTFAGSEFAKSQHAIEYKVRTRPGYEVFAMYVEGVGSLIARPWDVNEGRTRIEFRPYRDTTFFASVKDDAHVIEAPCALWANAYCADKIAMADKKMASVVPYVLEGREYIVTGISWSNEVAKGDAWTFCRFADWTGPAYTYPERNKAADEGRVERGDYRGHIIMVRGQKCVIDGYAHVIGHDAKTYRAPVSSESEDDQVEVFDDDE